MRRRDYGQFCGLARAAEVLGQRWTLLILRDLLVGPRRYTDLLTGLPGVPTNMLATRLKELEADGLVRREARSGTDRSVVYRVTPRGAELAPALDTLARWGAAGMRQPRAGEVVTEASLVTALRVAATDDPPSGPAVVFVVEVGDAVASARVGEGAVAVAPGGHPDPDLVIAGGAEFRDVLAGRLGPREAVERGAVELAGDPELFSVFVETFRVPYSGAAELEGGSARQDSARV